MDAAQALADLTEISSQIEAAVLFDDDGDASPARRSATPSRRGRSAHARRAKLLEDAAAFRSSEPASTQLEASTPDGSVFVVRDGRSIAATTGRRRPSVSSSTT